MHRKVKEVSANEKFLTDIPELRRFENTQLSDFLAECQEMTHSTYPHRQIYGSYCTLQEYVNCPPDDVYDYLRRGHHLEEWTYSVRDFEPTGTPGLWVGKDRLEAGTSIYCKVHPNDEARTVDFHCAWDQGDDLWMIYMMRVIPAELVFKRPGSVILWTNCRHPYYDDNPYPELAPRPDRVWVGDFWDELFYSGHTVEMQNLKKILEYRHLNGLPVSVPPLIEVTE